MSYQNPLKFNSALKEAVQAGRDAEMNLNTFAQVEAVCETIRGTSAAAKRIIAIAQKEQQRQLRIMDRADKKIASLFICE